MNFQISKERCLRLATLGEPYDIAVGGVASNAVVRLWHCEKCLWQSKTNGLTQGQATEAHDAANIVLRVRCNSIPTQKPNAASETRREFGITTMEQPEQKPAAEWEGRLHNSQEWEDIWPEHDGQMSYGADITYVEIRRKGTDALT